jgi:hypothetical protein
MRFPAHTSHSHISIAYIDLLTLHTSLSHHRLLLPHPFSSTISSAHTSTLNHLPPPSTSPLIVFPHPCPHRPSLHHPSSTHPSSTHPSHILERPPSLLLNPAATAIHTLSTTRHPSPPPVSIMTLLRLIIDRRAFPRLNWWLFDLSADSSFFVA